MINTLRLLQAIFWYGKPGDYANTGEIEFFHRVPTVWNESLYLAGSIGKHLIVVLEESIMIFFNSPVVSRN